MNLNEWEDPDPGQLYTPTDDAGWNKAIQRYLPTRNNEPLLRCVTVARECGARSMVQETRYLGADYRSEYSAFYSKVFDTIPPSAHRLHFFDQPLTRGQLSDLPDDVEYLGYVVVRPSPIGAVACANLRPPPQYANAVRTAVTDVVTFFGQQLQVTGMPFSQQDTRLGSCAHAAAWMCHYSAYRKGYVARRPTADFALNADASLMPLRPVPTSGLTVDQLSDLFRRFDLPPMFYLVGDLPHPGLPWQPPPPEPIPGQRPGQWDTRIASTVRRHLDSGFPVLVGTINHAFVLCGWFRDPENDTITFIRNDDQQGPYLEVSDPLSDVFVHPNTGRKRSYGPWETLHIPVPNKVWLLPEGAETSGGFLLRAASERYAEKIASSLGSPIEDLPSLIADDRLELRTYVTTANGYKRDLVDRGLDTAIVDAYRLARFSHYLVVVEAIDKNLRLEGRPSVIGEAIFDATSPDTMPKLLAFRIHGVVTVWQTNGERKGPILTATEPVRSGGIGPE